MHRLPEVTSWVIYPCAHHRNRDPTQQELEIFRRLRGLLRRYEGPLTSRWNLQGLYELWSSKDVVTGGEKEAGDILRFHYHPEFECRPYFMPVYTHPELKESLTRDLRKLLKGKSCFHIRNLNENIEQQISDLLARGFEIYRQSGWI